VVHLLGDRGVLQVIGKVSSRVEIRFLSSKRGK
jgi:hypothetical protein